MKILHILWAFDLGGIESMLTNIINEQVVSNEVFFVVIGKKTNEQMCQKLDKRVHLIFLNRDPKSRSVLPFIRLNWIAIKNHIDVIHVHNASTSKILLPFFLKKTCFTLHDTFMHRYIKLKDLLRIRKVFSISQAVANQVQADYGVRTIVCVNGIQCDLFEKKKDFTKKSLFKIVQISRFDCEKKGQLVLINAAKMLVDQGIHDFTIDFIGDGDDLNLAKDLTRNLHLKNIVHFLGSQSQAYIEKNLCSYDLLVQPSYYEGFGLTVAEAMAAKVPVLVSDIQGPMEIIDQGEFGHFFKCGDVVSCAKKIKELVACGVDESAVNAAYSRVVNCYNVKETANLYLLHYANL